MVFAYGTSSTLSGASTTTSVDLGAGTTAVGISANLTGLTAGTKYYYQVQATNSAGTTNGAISSFTTSTVPPPSGLQFIPVTPCRIADTRNANGAFGGPELGAGATRTFNIPQSSCGIPTNAAAYSLNVTVVPNAGLGYLTIWPSGEAQPLVSTLNSPDGRIKANAAIVPAGTNGGVNVYVSDATQVILDIDGYFVPAGGSSSALAFYPLHPCRVADTRNASGSLGGPSIAAGSSRAFPVLSSNCGIPSTAKAYSLNVTAVPTKPSAMSPPGPRASPQPGSSTLNAQTGAITANAAIVEAGTSGQISVYASHTADVVLDVNGYFAAPASGGLSLYTLTPCRVIDTRPNTFAATKPVSVEGSSCAPSASAQAYVLNATVVPSGYLGYLALWPAGQSQPVVSTLNAQDGAITSNMANRAHKQWQHRCILLRSRQPRPRHSQLLRPMSDLHRNGGGAAEQVVCATTLTGPNYSNSKTCY